MISPFPKRLFIALLLSVSPVFIHAQDQMAADARTEFRLEGSLGLSVGADFYSMTVGGPSLLLAVSPKIKLGVGAFPSLYLHHGKLGARLGVGPRVDIRHWFIYAPIFHKESNQTWIPSLGLGYRFVSGTSTKKNRPQ